MGLGFDKLFATATAAVTAASEEFYPMTFLPCGFCPVVLNAR
jgi:hypothetical protein